MFAAIPLAVRIGGPIALALLVAGGWYLYKESLRDEGREECKEEQAKDVAEQREHVREFEIAQYESKIAILKRQMAEKEDYEAKNRAILVARDAEIKRLHALNTAIKTQQPEVIHEPHYIEVEKEVAVLVPYDVPCFVSWGDVDLIDNLTRVLNEIPYSRVPELQPTGQRSDLSRPSTVPCAAFTKRIAELTPQLGHVLINHRTVSEHGWNQYQQWLKWKERVGE